MILITNNLSFLLTITLLIIQLGCLSGLHISDTFKKKPCLDREFTCHDSYCIALKWVCDGNEDCDQGEDELNCYEVLPEVSTTMTPKVNGNRLPAQHESKSYENILPNTDQGHSYKEPNNQIDESLITKDSTDVHLPDLNNAESLVSSEDVSTDHFPDNIEISSEQPTIAEDKWSDTFPNSEESFDESLVFSRRMSVLDTDDNEEKTEEDDYPYKNLPDNQASTEDVNQQMNNLSKSDINKTSYQPRKPDQTSLQSLREVKNEIKSMRRDIREVTTKVWKSRLPEIDWLIKITKELKNLQQLANNTGNCSEATPTPQELIRKLTCPSQFQFISGNCVYIQIYPPVTWNEAGVICKNQRGSLILLHEMKKFNSIFHQMKFDKQLVYSFWIGGTSLKSIVLPFTQNHYISKTFSKNVNECPFIDSNSGSLINFGSCAITKGFICEIQLLLH